MKSFDAAQYLACIAVMGSEIEKAGNELTSNSQYGNSIEDFHRLMDLWRKGISKYKEIETVMKSITVPEGLETEHETLMSAYRDLIIGSEMQLNSITLREDGSNTGDVDFPMYLTGQGKHTLSKERTEAAIKNIIDRMTDLGLIL